MDHQLKRPHSGPSSRFKPFWRTSVGFSLIELLVTVAILAIVTLGSAQLFSSIVNQQKLIIQLMNKQELETLAAITLRSQRGCTDALAGTLIPTVETSPTAFAAIRARTAGGAFYDVVRAPPNPTIIGTGSASLQVTGLFLISQGPNAHPNPKLARVEIRYTAKGVADMSVTKRVQIPINVIPGAATTIPASDPNRVWRCYAQDVDNSLLCGMYGGTFDSATGRCTYPWCIGNICKTAAQFSEQKCPQAGQPAHYWMMIGLSPNGTIMCGPMPQ
jgi:prepilin-type N-terminal cleavage/methylation domain-containing protein